ncbi:Uncharacterised protein [Serratia liquefaciens]|uniref:hypothetical protein n=1 Tax=Serratia liquefaciens TaxID=614 RepID=UPI00217960BF|nr:hypothetical protein [Serratia liquefaciens]CAI1170737.1 Uncharacterised protein [Serratia liquefaciens]
MKNNLVNQDIKTDKPLVMTYEALKADRDAQQKRADALAVENGRLCKRLTHAEGCFSAAIFEGLDEALVESAGSNLADIVSRRIVYAFPSIKEPYVATSAALAAIQKQAGIEAVEEAAYSLYGKGYIFDTIMDYAAELREGK